MMLRLIFLPFSWLLNILPAGLFRLVACWLGGFFFVLVRFRREIVLSNLDLAFGDQWTQKQKVKTAKENYQHYAMIFLEWIRSVSWSRERFKAETELNWEPIKQQMSNGKGGLILTSHLGNWEFAIQAASAWGMPCDIVVKRQNNRLIQSFFDWFRTRYGARVIYESGGMRQIFKSLSENRFIVFVLDQFMGPPIGLPVKFFGKQAGTAVGLALLTEKANYSLFTAISERDKNGKISISLSKMPEPPLFSPDKIHRLYEKTQWYNDVLETQIKKNPSQWLWLHRRWKKYRGLPRWIYQGVGVVLLSVFCLIGCSSSSQVATPTGIELPPDPTISIPNYESGPSAKPTPTKQTSIPKKIKKKKEAISSLVQKETAFTVVPVENIPFEVGEKLVIDLTWLALPAGRGVLEVRPGPNLQGRPTFHLWGNVLSSRVVDAIYHVDNTIESFIDQQGFIPYKFLLSMFETAQKKETRVAFDHPQAKALYWSKRISEKWGNQDIDRTDAIVPKSYDMFSALYYARSFDFDLNKKESFWIYENGQNLSVELLPIAKEIVTTKAGVFQCWKIKVDVKLNNVLRPTGDLYMWLSDDSKKYLVKFDAKVKIGSLMGRLISVRER